MHNCARLGNPSKVTLRSVTLLGLPSLNPSKLLRSAGALQAHAHACSCVAGGSDRVNSRACCSRRLTLHGRANAPWNTLQARSRSAHLHLSRERCRVRPRSPKILTRLCQRQPHREAKGVSRVLLCSAESAAPTDPRRRRRRTPVARLFLCMSMSPLRHASAPAAKCARVHAHAQSHD